MDIITEIILFLIILILCILLRAIPHIRFYYPSSSDTFFFLNKIRNPQYRAEQVYYPELLVRMYRFFLRKSHALPDRRINQTVMVMDILTISVIYLYFRTFFGDSFALMTIFLYSISPFVVKQGATLTGRPLGLMLFTFSLLAASLPLPWNWIGVIPIALTLLAHRLSTQTLFFVCLASSIFNPNIGFTFIGGLILALILTKGKYLELLRNHVEAIWKFWRGKHFPNRRHIGIVLVPTVGGFIIYAAIFLLQHFITFPLDLGWFVLDSIPIINDSIQTMFFVWEIVCLILLIIWVAGQAYTYMYLAALPSAFFSTFLIFYNQDLLFILLLLIPISLALSLRFMIRFEHLDEPFVSIMRKLDCVQAGSRYLMPSNFLRASEFFSNREGVPVRYSSTSTIQLEEIVKEKNITHAIIEEGNKGLLENWNVLEHIDGWYLLELID